MAIAMTAVVSCILTALVALVVVIVAAKKRERKLATAVPTAKVFWGYQLAPGEYALCLSTRVVKNADNDLFVVEAADMPTSGKFRVETRSGNVLIPIEEPVLDENFVDFGIGASVEQG
jgi:hypothetical protein